MEKLSCSDQAIARIDPCITNRCNFKCPHCFCGEPGKQDLTLENLSFLLERVDNPYLDKIGLFGGEPRLHPQFTELMHIIVDFYREKGVEGGAITRLLS